MQYTQENQNILNNQEILSGDLNQELTDALSKLDDQVLPYTFPV